ncbi:hypothetical protein CBR_g48013 [Chara braunii]|uniref:Uncharacterized protein n=1 Tax=Chara braunii TaxID=69332 RepID=A0A388M1V4_CHABU|nr:hypothetical protein CBR_g48013 [Chara braunii]|eukprot:GBG88544.1 hypothetical protein CBR_g48013 [Chara braunii]
MASLVPEYHAQGANTDTIIVAVEDAWNAWPLVKEGFESRLPIKRATLNNKTRNPVVVDALPVEYVLSTSPRSRNRQDKSLHWFRNPYAVLYLVLCELEGRFRVLMSSDKLLGHPMDTFPADSAGHAARTCTPSALTA